jgi:succinyldiaminopimelate transaminase
MRPLPDFPWDVLAPHAERARAHPDGVVDLSVGTPVDPTPAVVRAALAAAADAPGYPLTAGSAALRESAARWLARRFGVAVDPTAVVPSVGSKELVALLPTLLGLGPGDRVLFPGLAYPTYDVGARLAGCEPVPVPTTDGLLDLDALRELGRGAGLLWLNSPANPHGRVTPPSLMADLLSWARDEGVVVASDECYVELGWEAEPATALEHDHTGLLVLHSLSKRSNLAGYRAGLVSGDPVLVRRVLEVRKHAGLIVPAPVQAAMVAALDDDAHVTEQRERYRRRREVLLGALRRAGWRVDHSEAGLYLWATSERHSDCWDMTAALAAEGILVAPGEFYGAQGRHHVRVALTATDERVATAAARLEGTS